MLREKDERERRAKQRKGRSYSRSSSRSFSRSPVRRMRSRSPRRRGSRSRSRSFSISRYVQSSKQCMFLFYIDSLLVGFVVVSVCMDECCFISMKVIIACALLSLSSLFSPSCQMIMWCVFFFVTDLGPVLSRLVLKGLHIGIGIGISRRVAVRQGDGHILAIVPQSGHRHGMCAFNICVVCYIGFRMFSCLWH